MRIIIILILLTSCSSNNKVPKPIGTDLQGYNWRYKMKRNNCYKYPKTQREKIEGKRHYVFDKEKLPSVTTILDITQPAEKRESLAKWRAREGEEQCSADRGYKCRERHSNA